MTLLRFKSTKFVKPGILVAVLLLTFLLSGTALSNSGPKTFTYKMGLKEININQQQIITDTLPEDTTIYETVQKSPQFPGGMKQFYLFLAKNIRYPADDLNKRNTGKVLISFTVEKDGTLSDIIIVEGVSPTINKEALRVMALSPNWEPGYMNDKPVRVKHIIHIRFNLVY